MVIDLKENLMASQADLDAALSKLSADVDALLALPPASVDLQAEVDAVNAIDAKVVAKLPPPSAPAS